MKKFGFAIVAIAAMTVLAPARSDAKKKNRDMFSSTMSMKMPKAAKVLKIKKGTLRVRNGLVGSKLMRSKARKKIAPLPDSGLLNRKLDMGNPKRPKVDFPDNVLFFPVK